MTPDKSRGEENGKDDEDKYRGGLLCGLAPWHIGVLAANPFDGGGGYTPAEVGEMTLDQIFMRLADLKILRKKPGGPRISEMRSSAVPVDSDGTTKVRLEDGTVKRMQYGGKSVARRLMEEEEEKKKEAQLAAAANKHRTQRREQRRQRRRQRNGN